VLDPEDRETVLERLVFPRQPAHSRICLADFYRPKDSGELDVVALQAVTVGPRVTEVITALEQEGEFAEQLFTHGLGVQSAEGTAEWLHSRVREDLGIGATQGRRYSWGYPACSTPRRSACRSPAATPSSPSSPRWRSSPTTRRRSTSA
jgi:5-methyltetrahydrofolate--homocysteine methyltransferase